MDNNSLERIRKLTKDKITVSNFQKEQKMDLKNKKLNIKKLSAVACFCIILTSGIVFAKDIQDFVMKRFAFGLGDGVDTAAENGYIAEPEIETVIVNAEVETPKDDKDVVQLESTVVPKEQIIANIDTTVDIDSFLMDDYNLSVEFSFKFDETINDVIDLDKLDQITLKDLIVLDEENRIIYASTFMKKQDFEEFCLAHELDYEFGQTNENYLNCGSNWFPQNVYKENNSTGLIYNMYTEGFPKSKELNFYFTEIKITEAEYIGAEKIQKDIVLKGDWNIHVDVPEKMYNRTSEGYRVVSCSNSRFNVYSAKVMDTGFEIGLTISDIENPKYPDELKQKELELMDKYEGVTDRDGYSKEWFAFLAQEPYREMWNNYQISRNPINVTGYNGFVITEEAAEQLLSNPDNYSSGFRVPAQAEGSYVLNSDDEKFTCTLSPSRKAYSKFVIGNKYDFYETFCMTKYDATDNIKVVLMFFGEPVTIELEKVK